MLALSRRWVSLAAVTCGAQDVSSSAIMGVRLILKCLDREQNARHRNRVLPGSGALALPELAQTRKVTDR